MSRASVLLCDGSLSEPVIQPVVPFDDLLEAYPKIANAPQENVKLGVAEPVHTSRSRPLRHEEVLFSVPFALCDA